MREAADTAGKGRGRGKKEEKGSRHTRAHTHRGRDRLVGRLVGRGAKVYPEKGYADGITWFRAIRSRMIRV